MSTITWPGFKTGPVSFGVEYDVQMTTMRNGRVLTYGLPGARWLASINFENELEQMQRPAIEAWCMRLEGGANRAQLYHLARPYPNGTLRGTPQVASTTAAGSRSVPLTNCSGTLKAGDMIGIGGQMLMVTTDATPVSTNMTVSINAPLRAIASIAAPVTWDKPTTLFVPRSTTAGPFPYAQNGLRPGFAIEFVEAW